ncbi:uncharacterized protein PGTG_00704 [Puccinia graminis f. sp. tritici CRL 75-36-700-3]|uniref:Myb/SANT-like domain-containing protein n=1 Tax=Puccinia graminis f. sp. tritici (strain CRL 75-36-700-3 / race SCCL) TaxID=418459 RepID=E3JRF3_PUCGT|nr:uncharacterized protein PGTG_00704 [Puccinia graminis f. sp. tritici CRL 75-36-700-3]EFP74748.1 hypothetical protein PGTG_00704 [Puccinia graminis f. sp. tritici CRL 75-36-700-3]
MNFIDPAFLTGDILPPALPSSPSPPPAPATVPMPTSNKTSATKTKHKATPKPTVSAQPSKDAPKPKLSAPPKKEKVDSKPNHIWTNNQRSSLLELIASQNAAGHATDNGNLKKEGWSAVIKKLNLKHGLDLTSEQVKNQKNQLRKLFVDYQFLRNQSGFGWDEDISTVTADETVWDELFDAHPRREFSKLKDKPFPLYDLALSVFDGTAASGETAQSHLFPATTDAVKLPPPSKRKIVTLKSDDENKSDIEIDPTTSLKTATSNATTPKRVRESKNSVIRSEMEGINGAISAVSENSKELMGAFSKISSAISKSEPKEATQPINLDSTNSANNSSFVPSEPFLSTISISEKALDLCAEKFLGHVADKTYVEFISILENETKARTFLALSRNSNNRICQIWLEKEVGKVKKDLFQILPLGVDGVMDLTIACKGQ